MRDLELFFFLDLGLVHKSKQAVARHMHRAADRSHSYIASRPGQTPVGSPSGIDDGDPCLAIRPASSHLELGEGEVPVSFPLVSGAMGP